MKHLIYLTLALTVIVTLDSCKTSKTTQTPDIPLFVEGNSANSLDWPGTYMGTLPCADCEGIVTTLTLHADLSYQLVTRYLGKSAISFTTEGKFEWNNLGNIITLNGVNDRPSKFLVGENYVLQLDMHGKPVTGDLADKYELKKQLSQIKDTALTDKRWKLTEINGMPIKDENQEESIYIEFKSGENKVNGFGGCNYYFGDYELKEGSRITFSKVASTMMACPDLSIEQALFKILQDADNYTIYNNELNLNKARMAPLAKFKAVE
ncbi:MAG: copper resistance protein NlpE N-terminal domain-containing protein [Lentimicrobiaceae bacterium]|nr:copper resistance protein NlpE N-terminal domain-containing protein [Lentimicrobiaceae bacterium]